MPGLLTFEDPGIVAFLSTDDPTGRWVGSRVGSCMSVLLAPFLTLAIVLVVSGVDKLWRPDGAAAALRSARITAVVGPGSIPRSQRSARAMGTLEAAIGVGAIAVPWITDRVVPSAIAALVMAGTYAGFAWFVTRLAAIDSTASCGCFGSSSPPGPAHRRLNLAAAGVSVAMVVVSLATEQAASLGIVIDAGAGTSLAVLVLVAAAVPLVLLAPGLLSDLDPRRVAAHTATVPVFAVNQPIGNDR